MGLFHESVGDGSNRRLVVYRTPYKPETGACLVSKTQSELPDEVGIVDGPTDSKSLSSSQDSQLDVVGEDGNIGGAMFRDQVDKDSLSGDNGEIDCAEQSQQDEIQSKMEAVHVTVTSGSGACNEPGPCSSTSDLGMVLEYRCSQLASKCSKSSEKPIKEKNKSEFFVPFVTKSL